MRWWYLTRYLLLVVTLASFAKGDNARQRRDLEYIKNIILSRLIPCKQTLGGKAEEVIPPPILLPQIPSRNNFVSSVIVPEVPVINYKQNENKVIPEKPKLETKDNSEYEYKMIRNDGSAVTYTKDGDGKTAVTDSRRETFYGDARFKPILNNFHHAAYPPPMVFPQPIPMANMKNLLTPAFLPIFNRIGNGGPLPIQDLRSIPNPPAYVTERLEKITSFVNNPLPQNLGRLHYEVPQQFNPNMYEPRYIYKQINHSNPNKLTVVNVEDKLIENNSNLPIRNLPHNNVFLPPASDNILLPPNPVPNTLKINQPSKNENIYINLPTYKPTTTLKKDNNYDKTIKNYFDRPIVVERENSLASNQNTFSYKQVSSNGPELSVTSDAKDRVTVKVNGEYLAKGYARGDIPDLE